MAFKEFRVFFLKFKDELDDGNKIDYKLLLFPISLQSLFFLSNNLF
jgi:hypothetical protein